MPTSQNDPYSKFRENVLSKGKKRILALDGGGIRGLFTVQLLKRLETIIREKTNNPHALLRDYFQLVGGTSTGAIIASAIAIGKTADELDDLYRELSKIIFKNSWFRYGIIRAKFATKPINECLEKHFENRLMKDITREGIALGIVTKRLDTGSVWVVDNNPDGQFFAEGNGDNGSYVLKQIIRASTAAPSFFSPEIIKISEGVWGKFIDGGVSPHNNPALQLLMLATMKGYHYQWDTGEDELFILSMGTGSWEQREHIKQGGFSLVPSAIGGAKSLMSLMDDTTELNQAMMQWFGKPIGPSNEIDLAMGTLENEMLTDNPLFSYTRYDAILEADWLAKELGITDYSEKQIKRMRKMDVLDTMDMLSEVGKAYAEQVMSAEHIR